MYKAKQLEINKVYHTDAQQRINRCMRWAVFDGDGLIVTTFSKERQVNMPEIWGCALDARNQAALFNARPDYNIEIFHDGCGGIVIEDHDKHQRVELENDETAGLINLMLNGLCHICHKEVNEGSSLCCGCFEQERRWHETHCETNGMHQA